MHGLSDVDYVRRPASQSFIEYRVGGVTDASSV